jgi:hypothetical protein
MTSSSESLMKPRGSGGCSSGVIMLFASKWMVAAVESSYRPIKRLEHAFFSAITQLTKLSLDGLMLSNRCT